MKRRNEQILVLDADQRSALAATRALGAAGFTVHTGDTGRTALASRSKWSVGHLQYPDPSTGRDAALTAIGEYCKNHAIDLLFPMTDVTTPMIQTAIDVELPPTPCPPRDVYDTASDKGRLMQCASEAGLAIPRTQRIDGETSLTSLPDGFEYPVVLKPTRSRIPLADGFLHTQVMVAHSDAELTSLQREHIWFRNHPWLLQSFVEGKGQGVFALYDRGQPIAWFAHRRIREKPPQGGVSVLSASAPMANELKESATTLLNALAWHGPAMVEYRVTADGTPYLMEINARFWGSLQLAISAGVDFPVLAAELTRGKHPAPLSGYRLGIKNRWLLGDLDNLYLTFKSDRFTAPKKLAAALRFLLPWTPGLRYEVLRLGDLAPFRYELKRYFGFSS
ncbi:MAG: ATP-grasp domain-containing protein [Pseudomonadota bacterium]